MTRRKKYILFGGLIGLFIGISFSVLFFSGTIDDIILFRPFLYLIYIDLIGFILCQGICQDYSGLIYLITTPLSLIIYGTLGGFIYAHINKDKEYIEDEKTSISKSILYSFIFGLGGFAIGAIVVSNVSSFGGKFYEVFPFGSYSWYLIWVSVAVMFGLISRWDMKAGRKSLFLSIYLAATLLFFFVRQFEPDLMILLLGILHLGETLLIYIILRYFYKKMHHNF